MSGMIRNEDIAYVRENVRIDDVVGDYLPLKQAGGDQKKGLCPFHDEKSPSFHVTLSKGYFHCFGCHKGGDAIKFIMDIDHISFVEAVEKLAGRIGYQLTYEGGKSSDYKPGLKSRLIAANTAAQAFYQNQLNTNPDSQVGRDFLMKRGFDRVACESFGVGYAPDDWDQLTKYLKGQGFTNEELDLAGLSKEGQKGMIDRFRNRLIWPIRSITGDVVGFGARKLSEEDQGPKYLNTSETPIYKKSQVLYGLDKAKKEIATKRQVVVVEGYTDVMAAHLAGVTTAVATCGTAFGDDHIRILRNLLMDDDAFRGEVIFTFDGDAAGQKAALRAYDDDQKFVTQTFVAVEPNGMDPCELRQAQGDSALRDLIASRIPLFEFAIRTELKKHDLQTAEGRVNALSATSPMVASIKNKALRPEYVKQLALWLGMDIDPVSSAVSQIGGKNSVSRNDSKNASNNEGVVGNWRPDPKEPTLILEREVLKTKLQLSGLANGWSELPANSFSHPAYQALRGAIDGGALLENIENEDLKSLYTELSVEPIRADGEISDRYVESIIARLHEVAISRTIADTKSKLQRINPTEPEYQGLFAELVTLESQRRALREKALGSI
ncbi:MAG: DNA primase [Candidatus Nanopelagicaceae bacterium]